MKTCGKHLLGTSMLALNAQEKADLIEHLKSL